MIQGSWEIAGGDYESAGAASAGLKEMLRRLGADGQSTRRAMIAAYEAEMNVVVHACKGRISIAVTPERVDVEVEDEGPGIPDVARAMVEGFTTASDEARALGFGAGLGLPNIRKHTDRLEITTEVGRGTKLAFVVTLKPADHLEAAESARNSVATPEACRLCMRCVAACPTGAMRVRGRPTVLPHLCIDCAECMRACPERAIRMDLEETERGDGAALVCHESFLAQYGRDRQEVTEAFTCLGYERVISTAPWERALRRAVIDYAASREADGGPTISPVCPAVVNLVAMRYPSLLTNIAPFVSAMEAVRMSAVWRPSVFVVQCPAVASAMGMAKKAPPGRFRQLVNKLDPHRTLDAKARGGRLSERRERLVKVSGLRHVARVLDLAERRALPDGIALELHACDGGCWGSPLLLEDACVARADWLDELAAADDARAEPRAEPIRARRGLRLDDDMREAIRKLKAIDLAAKSLPGRDCGACGSPSCAAFSEDIVLRNADKAACVHLRRTEEEE